MWWRELEVAAPGALAWAPLVDTRRWPEWGPTVAAVRLDHAGHQLRADSTGAVRTPLGVWLPFVVSSWDVSEERSAWSWRVAGMAATSHEVVPLSADRCRLRLGVPAWAPAYLPVVEVGLRRLRRLAEGGPLG